MDNKTKYARIELTNPAEITFLELKTIQELQDQLQQWLDNNRLGLDKYLDYRKIENLFN